jgi:hypothetical protein
MWKNHPEIAKKLEYSGVKDDGITWIDLKDIQKAAKEPSNTSDPIFNAPWLYMCQTLEDFEHLKIEHGSFYANKLSHKYWPEDSNPVINNPQYHLHIVQEATECIITLKERDTRFFPGKCSYWLPMWIDIYKPKDKSIVHQKLLKTELRENFKEIATSSGVGKYFSIDKLKFNEPGHYVIVLSADLTFSAQDENVRYEQLDYILSVRANKNILLQELV